MLKARILGIYRMADSRFFGYSKRSIHPLSRPQFRSGYFSKSVATGTTQVQVKTNIQDQRGSLSLPECIRVPSEKIFSIAGGGQNSPLIKPSDKPKKVLARYRQKDVESFALPWLRPEFSTSGSFTCIVSSSR